MPWRSSVWSGLTSWPTRTFRHPDVKAIESLVETARSPEADGEALASQIRQMTDSDLVAIGRITNGDMTELFLSDQPQSTKRASLPGQLKTEMLNAVQSPERHSEYHVAEQNGSAVALKVENARRNESLAPIFAQMLNSGARNGVVAAQPTDAALGQVCMLFACCDWHCDGSVARCATCSG